MNLLDYLRDILRYNGLPRSCVWSILGVLALGLLCWGLIAVFGG